jgi:hypothetical protein
MRFKKIPKKIESSIKRVSSAVALKSLVVKAAGCQTLGEFAAVLK